MRQHYTSFYAEESSTPANKFRQGPRQQHRNWWSHEYSARAPKYWGRASSFDGHRQRRLFPHRPAIALPLYRNDGNRNFTDVSYASGVALRSLPFVKWALPPPT